MGCNAASLMAGGRAVYLNFDTGSTQNIIKSLKSSAGAFTNSVGCKYTAALMRGGWVGNSVQTVNNWMNLSNPSEHVNVNQVLMLYFLKSPLAALWQLNVRFRRVQAGSWYRLQWTFTQSHFQSIDDFLENVWSCFPPAGSVCSCQDSFGKAPLQSWLSLLAMGFCWWQFCRVSR